jgi:hypothetical protein
MYPSLDHSQYQKLFSEVGVGFRLEHAGLVSYPNICQQINSTFLLVVSF